MNSAITTDFRFNMDDYEVSLVMELLHHYSKKNDQRLTQTSLIVNAYKEFQDIPPELLRIHESFTKAKLIVKEYKITGYSDFFWKLKNYPTRELPELTAPGVRKFHLNTENIIQREIYDQLAGLRLKERALFLYRIIREYCFLGKEPYFNRIWTERLFQELVNTYNRDEDLVKSAVNMILESTRMEGLISNLEKVSPQEQLKAFLGV